MGKRWVVVMLVRLRLGKSSVDEAGLLVICL